MVPWPKTNINYWQDKKDPLHLQIHPGGFFSVNIFGAISNKQPELNWLVSNKGNKFIMADFIKHIDDVPLDPKKTVFVMDNS